MACFDIEVTSMELSNTATTCPDVEVTSMESMAVTTSYESQVINGIETRVEEDDTIWLPALDCRPVLPLEQFTFRACQPAKIAAVKIAWESGKQLAGLAKMPSKEGRAGEQLGVTLDVEKIVELPCGGLEVSAVGVRSFRVVSRNVLPCRVKGAPTMSKAVKVEWLRDKPRVTAWECVAVRKHVLSLLRDAQDETSDSDIANSDLAMPFFTEAPLQDDAEFSWKAAAMLPLPPAARGKLLRINTPRERLSVCAQVLAAHITSSIDRSAIEMPLMSRL